MAAFGGPWVPIDEKVAFIESLLPRYRYVPGSPGISSFPGRRSSRVPPRLSPPGIAEQAYFASLITSPPPGLVRVSPPVYAFPRYITSEDVSLFSEFASYLDTGVDEAGRSVALDLTCLICQENYLEVPESVACHRPVDCVEGLAVLPCGHFFGSDCLYRWLKMTFEGEDDAADPCCPLCRFKMLYRCDHLIQAKEYEPYWERARQIPLTIPEGGRVPEQCDDCYRDACGDIMAQLKEVIVPPFIDDFHLLEIDTNTLQDIAFRLGREVKDLQWIIRTHILRW
ncbi:hypothetical protein F5Y18DRAFT_425375 [Xylariaceae sp. FL1019]|nr:hypothetical protein F5Y18DRAFT_425375 [Xylariaceae sp. FL1019]